MRIGVLGTGNVGRTLASALLSSGHEVRLGSRTAGNEAAVAWAEETGGPASEGTFADAAGFGEILVNGTAGAASLDALALAGELLRELGWPASSILDLGDIGAARGMEMYLPLWLRLWQASGTGVLNVEVRAGE